MKIFDKRNPARLVFISRKSQILIIEKAEKLTPEGDSIWEELTEEVSELNNDVDWKIKPDTAFEDLAMGAMVS